MTDENTLKAAIAKASAPLYAVLDGAQFDDLPGLLFDHDFKHKPLYMDMGSEDKEVAKTAPQFVRFDKWDYWENDLTPAQRAESLIDILELPASAVFWASHAEPKLLFRHLRTINYIMIPRDADTPPLPDPLDPDAAPDGNTATHQRVLFRHADANVIAQVVPELGEHRLPRFFGPADSIICKPDAEWGMGEEVLTLESPGGEWNAKQMVTLSERTMARIEVRRVEILRFNVGEFLRDMLPDETDNMSDKDVYDYVIRTEASAEDIGISSMDGLSMWAYLSMRSHEASLTDKKLREYFGYQLHPNDALIAMSKKIIDMNPVRIEDLL